MHSANHSVSPGSAASLPDGSSRFSWFASVPFSFQSARGLLAGLSAPRETSSSCGRLVACRAAVSATS